ncbi:MAG: hypothetical protein IT281_06720 [Ignavibacteria bacterium]|nr:hypothetical protein [Ignavibacteria bacterium]
MPTIKIAMDHTTEEKKKQLVENLTKQVLKLHSIQLIIFLFIFRNIQ